MQPFLQTILHPTDFSPHSELAFQIACSLAHNQSVRLVVLHVANPPVVIYDEKGELLPKTDFRAAAKEHLANQVSGVCIPLECRVEEGAVDSVILDVAKEISADLIVLGSQGRTGLDRLLIGSVAEQVLRRAGCAVLTVRLPKSGRPVGEDSTTNESVGAS